MFLGDLPGGPIRSWGNGVSDNGMVVAGEGRYGDDSLEVQAYRWTPGTGMVGIGFLAGGTYSTATGLSADGLVVVGTSQSTERSREAFRWTESAGMQGLGGLSPGTNSFAFDVTPDGSMIVGNGHTGVQGEAAYWTEADGWVSIGKLPGGLDTGAFATDVSADGSVIVGNSSSTVVPYAFEPFRWTESGGMQGLGLLQPDHDMATATGLSGDGLTVVGVSGPFSGISRKPFIWDETNGMRELRVVLETDYGLDLTGWALVEVLDISEDGNTIVGFGTNPLGITEGWIAVIPEPSTLGLLLIGGLCIALRRRV
jgi:probable HAF family extracellular repeat protein